MTAEDREFWMQVFIAAIRAGDGPAVAESSADTSVLMKRNAIGSRVGQPCKDGLK